MIVFLCYARGHIGGLLGGALAAYLLGPRLIVEGLPAGANKPQQFVLRDKPIIPIFSDTHRHDLK
jgi:hypothetical protein